MRNITDDEINGLCNSITMCFEQLTKNSWLNYEKSFQDVVAYCNRRNISIFDYFQTVFMPAEFKQLADESDRYYLSCKLPYCVIGRTTEIKSTISLRQVISICPTNDVHTVEEYVALIMAFLSNRKENIFSTTG